MSDDAEVIDKLEVMVAAQDLGALLGDYFDAHAELVATLVAEGWAALVIELPAPGQRARPCLVARDGLILAPDIATPAPDHFDPVRSGIDRFGKRA